MKWWDEQRLSALQQGQLRKWGEQLVRTSDGVVSSRLELFERLGAPLRLVYGPVPTRSGVVSRWSWAGYWDDPDRDDVYGYDVSTVLVKAADPGIPQEANRERFEAWKAQREVEKERARRDRAFRSVWR